MANIVYTTTEKPAIQKAVCKAIDWIGVRQTSYSEICRQAHCLQSDCRYAILDLIEKGYIIRHQTKGFAGTTRGNRYAYEVTEAGKVWMEKPLEESKQESKKETKSSILGLFVE